VGRVAPGTPAVVVDAVAKRYEGRPAVDGVSLEVRAGEVVALLGPNGAGKTTTIRVMMGILRASSGRVILGGHDVAQEPQQAKAIAGFIPDRPFIYEKLSGKEFLTFIAKLHRMESARLRRRIDELLEYFELANWQDELVEGFSHGMKQRLVLCAALVHEPRILVVDEPMVGLDPKGARTIKDLFRSLAKAGTAVRRITQGCIEILGPMGVSREHLLEKWFRDVRITDIYEGTGEIQRMITARALLGYGREELN